MTPSSTIEEESQLVERLKAGEDAAFTELVQQNIGRMVFVAKRYVKNQEDAEEAVQEAFTQAFRHMHSFQATSKISTWLHTIVVNQCLMKLRSKKGKEETSIDEWLPQFDETDHKIPDAPIGMADVDLDAQIDRRTQIAKAVDKLPDQYRSVILLRDMEGYSTSETAEKLGISEAAVKTNLHRARGAMRTLLAPFMGLNASKEDKE